ncbi:unnamed protein product [Closterium sp. NIES-54]
MHNGASRANRLRASASVRTTVYYGATLDSRSAAALAHRRPAVLAGCLSAVLARLLYATLAGGRPCCARGGSGGGQRQRQQRRSETPSPQQLREWLFQHGASGGNVSYSYIFRTGDRAGQTCGKPHTQHRCFSRLNNAGRAEFGDECVPPGPGIEAAALGASESSLRGTILGVPSSTSLTPPLLCPSPDQSQLPLQPASPMPAPSPYIEQSGGLTERREPASCPVLPARTARCVPSSRPPPVPGTHAMALRPSSVPLRVPLPPPPDSSVPAVPDPGSDLVRAASPTVSRLLTTVVTDPSFESAAASALSASASPRSVGGECALGRDVLEDRQEDFECLAAAVPRFASMLLAPEGDPDAPDIPTPRSYAEAIMGPYSSQWRAAMEVHRHLRRRSSPIWAEHSRWHVDFQGETAAGFSACLQGALRCSRLHLHEEIWLRHPPGLTGSFPAGTKWSLRRPVNGLRQAPREWHDTLRTTLVALGFAPSTTDPSLFLRTDTSLPPFYVLVYVDNLVFATADTKALTLVKSELQKRHTCSDMG